MKKTREIMQCKDNPTTIMVFVINKVHERTYREWLGRFHWTWKEKIKKWGYPIIDFKEEDHNWYYGDKEWFINHNLL